MSRTLAIANRKGGVGKTLVAVNLAAILSRRRPVVLVDADPQGSSSSWIADSPELPVLRAHDPETLRRVLAAARPGAGVVVVDLPPLDADMTALAVERADLVLVPVVPSPVSLRAVAPFLESLAAGRRRALVVLNQVKANTGVARTAREAFEGLGVPVARAEIGFRVAHAEAEAHGRAVVDYSPGARAAEELLALAREVRALLEA